MSEENKTKEVVVNFGRDEIEEAISIAKKGFTDRVNKRKHYMEAVAEIEAQMNQLQGQILGYETLLKGEFKKIIAEKNQLKLVKDDEVVSSEK